MMPGPTSVQACPHCGCLAKESSWASGNTFGARWWTDGRMTEAMLPEDEQLARCRQCRKFFWLRDAKEVGQLSAFGLPGDDKNLTQEWLDAEWVGSLTKEELYEALAAGVARKRSEEVYLRVRAWWLDNDRDREWQDKKPTQYAPIWSNADLENMAKLYKQIGTRTPGTRLMKAELARQMDQPAKALRLLEKPLPDEYAPWAAAIHAAIARHDDLMVKEVTPLADMQTKA